MPKNRSGFGIKVDSALLRKLKIASINQSASYNDLLESAISFYEAGLKEGRYNLQTVKIEGDRQKKRTRIQTTLCANLQNFLRATAITYDLKITYLLEHIIQTFLDDRNPKRK